MSNRLPCVLALSLLACSPASSSSGDGGTTESGASDDGSSSTAEGGGGQDGASAEGAPPDGSGGSTDASSYDAVGASDGPPVLIDGGTVSIACYIASQDRCHEYPKATAMQLTDLPVECSSTSGVLSMPGACPMTGFLGKCTIGTGAGSDVMRWYAPADGTYEMSYCASPANGVWSTTF
jgi:hypothetical protein